MKNQKEAERPQQGRPKDEAKRADIISAASELFLSKGFGGTSMNAVAQKARVSKLTIYSHFTDKDELFRAVISRRCEKHYMNGNLATFADLPIEQALTKIGHNFCELILSKNSLAMHTLLQMEGEKYPQIAQMFYEAGPQQVKRFFAELLTAFEQKGVIQVPNKEKAAEQFHSLLKGCIHMRALLRLQPPPSEQEVNEHIEETVRFFLSAYKIKQ